MSRTATLSPVPTSHLWLALALWAGAAGALAASDVLVRTPALIPLTLVTSLTALIIAYRRAPAVRRVVDRLDVRRLLAAHVVRAPIGLMFLLDDARGLVPSTFAQRAGWGDLLAGLGALALALASRRGRGWNRAARIWSVVGALDLLLVLATANYLLFVAHDPLMLSAITRLPYPLLPTLVVPLLLAFHLAIWLRLRRSGAGAS